MSQFNHPYLLSACLAGCVALAIGSSSLADTRNQKPEAIFDNANELIRRQPGFFVPNLGQWQHPARFVHRSGAMSLFLKDRGWVLDLVERPVEPETRPQALDLAMRGDRGAEEQKQKKQKSRGVALQMTFEGDTYVPEIVGEKQFPGHHNYFLGNDESYWRTGVPLYASVCYQDLYPGIDLRLREMIGVPEYDLLLQPGANLAAVRVHVEGGQGLSIAKDGSLIIQTELGPVTQPRPKTWTVDAYGRKHEVACNFTLLGTDRFGFLAPGWDGDTSLNIDPPLIWSSFLGSSRNDAAFAVSVDAASGIVTVAGTTESTSFPTTIGAYDRAWNNGTHDAFVSRLDPSKRGNSQLVYSTFLGGSSGERAIALSVNASGMVTVVGGTQSGNFPTTGGAYDTIHNGGLDAFVSRLDLSKTGSGQLVYSTLLGGAGWDTLESLTVDASGVVTVAGQTASSNFPTTGGAYDTIYNGGGADAIVSRLDPSKSGSAQLIYSTFLGGDGRDQANQLSVDASGVVTVAGFSFTASTTKFPTTGAAYNTIHNGGADAFVTRLDPRKSGNSQLIYSTFLGGSRDDNILGLFVDAKEVVTVAGWTSSSKFPTTASAYDTIYNGGNNIGLPGGDAFVTRLIPRNIGRAGLLYSTFLGSSGDDYGGRISVDVNGVVTVTGSTLSPNFPTTKGAYDTIYNGAEDAFVARLDPSRSQGAQLIYSTFLGGSGQDRPNALFVDASGVATVAGFTGSSKFPTTSGAYDTIYNGGNTPLPGNPRGDAFVSRLSMGVAFYADRYELLLKQAGTQQKLTLDAGKQHANRSYWILGSVTGTKPGITLLGTHFPLNPDLYTDITIGLATLNPPFVGFTGKLNGSGQATAAFKVPPNSPALNNPVTLNHAYLVYDAQGWHMVSNPVPLQLK